MWNLLLEKGYLEVNVNLIKRLRQSLVENQQFYPRSFSETEMNSFCSYYQIVLKWNQYIPLTTITTPSEFAERNLLEAAFTSQYLLHTTRRIWDIGSGVGIPGVPLAILRPDLTISLIESNKKKSIFLKEVVSELGIDNVQIVQERFQNVTGEKAEDCVITRAIDGLSKQVQDVLSFGQGTSQIILLGNPIILERSQKYLNAGWETRVYRIPKSENRLAISFSRFT